MDAGRPDIKVITNDIDEPILVNMVRGGNIVGAVEDMTYNNPPPHPLEIMDIMIPGM